MKDFTLKQYKSYLIALKNNIGNFLRFDEFIASTLKPEKFCLIRHDVDRKPNAALDMAKLEYEMGIVATYYFRAKNQTFKPTILKKIAAMGHEIGYHYESLSDANGDITNALEDFKKNLEEFRKIVPIKTCSMHGRPLKPHDNRDIWKVKENHQYLKNELGIIGEVYLDIDYSDIAYINDTGRNWTSGKANRRDKVNSKILADFYSGEDLLEYLSSNPHPKVCFQIHPERWSNNSVEWITQYIKDSSINAAKVVFSQIKK
ncbi:MAG: hypothetical protein ACK455_11820 [Bacteroidota bacterium]|jgi:hypothetical protein